MRGHGAVMPPSVRGRSSSSPPCRSDSPSPVRGRGTGAHTARGRSSQSPPFRSMCGRGAVMPPSAHGQSKVTSPPVQCHHQATHTLPGTDTAPECELLSYIGNRKTITGTSGYHSTDTLIVTDSDTGSETLHACEPQDPASHNKRPRTNEARTSSSTRVALARPRTKEACTSSSTRVAPARPTMKEACTSSSTRVAPARPRMKEAHTSSTTRVAPAKPRTKEACTHSTTRVAPARPRTKEACTNSSTRVALSRPITTRSNTCLQALPRP